MTSYLQNYKSYQAQILHQECFYGYNDSRKVSFQSVDVNLDFWHLPPPLGPGERLKRPGPDRVKEDLRVESQASWEKFCNSISLQSDPSESWRKIKNFLKPKGQHDYPTLRHDDKVTKTNADKVQLFAESVERHFCTESKHFYSNHSNEVNRFIEDNHKYFYPPEDSDDYRFDVGHEHASSWKMSTLRHSLS